jgi:hypothetical protein
MLGNSLPATLKWPGVGADDIVRVGLVGQQTVLKDV